MTRRFRFELGLPFLESVQVEITVGDAEGDGSLAVPDAFDGAIRAVTTSPPPSAQLAPRGPGAPEARR